jgi:hypothetical protein
MARVAFEQFGEDKFVLAEMENDLEFVKVFRPLLVRRLIP